MNINNQSKLIATDGISEWRELDGVIYFSITDDRSPEQRWIDYCVNKKIKVDSGTNQILSAEDFNNHATPNVKTQIAVLKGELWQDKNRTTDNIHLEALSRNFSRPRPELVCLTANKFSDEDLKRMNLTRIVFMHEPINLFGDYEFLATCLELYGRRIIACTNHSGDEWWCESYGFAFEIASLVNE